MKNFNTVSETINRSIIYDKFLLIEGWAERGRLLSEKGLTDKAREALRRIHRELRELDVVMKYNPDIEL